ncbi:MAG: dihydroorotate dehydrogenase [Deltaproteobacteria bacterium]|nr:dihydroorotate dehydrogenase [Deltaproteobacteria bacterium]
MSGKKGRGGGPDLRVDIGGGLSIRNPIMTASGTFGYGDEFADFIDLGQLGAVVVKSISLAPRPGNQPPRLQETPAGMINSIGIMSVGVDAFIRDKLPPLRKRGVPVVASVFGTSVKEFVEVTRRLDDAEGIAALEVNVGCPNIEKGTIFGTDRGLTTKTMRGVRRATRLPVILKLTPSVADVRPFAKLGEDEGADAISLINSIPALSIDIRTRRSRIHTGVGGLSGPAIRPIAVRMVWEAARTVSIPVIGIGGIATAEDVMEFLIAGATAVQVGTINFVRPRAAIEILEGLRVLLLEQGVRKMSEIVGTLRGMPAERGGVKG